MNKKRKIILAATLAIVIVALSLIVVLSQDTSSPDKLARVACLGDSITQNTGYPAALQALLGNSSVVGNFGSSGSAVTFDSTKPYFFQDAFRQARNFLPTTVVIMLGTNDAATDNYRVINEFVTDYEIIINNIESFSSKPQIFIVLPPPLYPNNMTLIETNLIQGVIPRIEQVANATGLLLINVYTPLLNHSEDFPDGVHPNNTGAQVIAETVYNAIKAS